MGEHSWKDHVFYLHHQCKLEKTWQNRFCISKSAPMFCIHMLIQDLLAKVGDCALTCAMVNEIWVWFNERQPQVIHTLEILTDFFCTFSSDLSLCVETTQSIIWNRNANWATKHQPTTKKFLLKEVCGTCLMKLHCQAIQNVGVGFASHHIDYISIVHFHGTGKSEANKRILPK